MKIKIWGCRGSIPAPGPSTVRYGGNTTCVEVRLADGTVVVLDAGTGMRNLGRALVGESSLKRITLLLTHAHWDHLMGMPFFEPAYLERFTIDVRGGPHARRSLRRYLRHQMEPPFFPVPFEALKATHEFSQGCGGPQRLGSAELEPILLNHPDGGYGFKLTEGEHSLVFLPDNELDHDHGFEMTREAYVAFSRRADILIHDAQYTSQEYRTRRGWGHSTYKDAIDLAAQAEVRTLILFHHDPGRTDDALDELVVSCQEHANELGGTLEVLAAREGMTLELPPRGASR